MSNKFKRFSISDTAALVNNTLLTVPTNTTAIVKTVIFANRSTGSRNATLSYAPVVNNVTATEVFLVPIEAVSANVSEDILNSKSPVVLEGGDILRCQSSGSSCDVTANVLFIDRE